MTLFEWLIPFFGAFLGALGLRAADSLFGRREWLEGQRDERLKQCLDAVDRVEDLALPYWNAEYEENQPELTMVIGSLRAANNTLLHLCFDLLEDNSRLKDNNSAELLELRQATTGGAFGEFQVSADLARIERIQNAVSTLRRGLHRRRTLLKKKWL